MVIDLRSDTISKPTAAMLKSMFAAEVGDDVFGEDPTVIALEEKIADLFGKEAAIYCPSGTMTNQIALRISTQPQDEVISDKRAHIYLYEGGGMMYNSMVSPKLLDGDRGRITAEQIAENINPDDVHFPRTSLVALENTMNKGGGCCYSLEEMRKIKALCNDKGLRTHLDGARVFNALVETRDDPREYGTLFDTISVCFSKGLGAPVGSALLGSSGDIRKARRVRKVFGGGMRQVGYLAAACIYALDHHVERLKDDHDRARVLGRILDQQEYVSQVYPVDTNIIIFEVAEPYSVAQVMEALNEAQILAVPFGKKEIRLVTHIDFY